MADNTAPFIITTQLDLAGINAGLAALSTKLATFRAPIIQTSGQQGTVGGLSPVVIKDTDTGMRGLAGSTGKMTNNMRRANRLLEEHNNKLGQTSNLLGDVSRRVFVWGAAAALIFGALSNLKEFFDLTIDTNAAMAELRKVLPDESDFAGLKSAGFDLAIEFGTAPADVFKVLKRFGQSGLQATEAIEATRTALLALNVTGADVEKVFNAIIGANKIFGISFENSARVIDKIQAVQANFAVDSKDLIASIQGIGPAITTLGGDIDDLFGNIAALSEAARVSGKEASNSLKRVFSRLISQEGITALKAIGVQVFATANTFRPLRNIMQDIADKWDTLTPAMRANLAITLAQVRQYSKLTALFQNFDRATEAIKISQNASGEAFRANEATLATFGKQTEIASNQLAKLAEEVVLGGGIADFFTNLKVGTADLISKSNPAFVALVANLIGAGIAVTAFTFIFPRATFVVNEHTIAQLRLALAMENTEKQNKALAVALGTKTTSRMKRLGQIVSVVGVAFLLVSVAYAKFTENVRRRNRIIEVGVKELTKLTDQINKFELAGRADTTGSNFKLLTTTFQKLKVQVDAGKLSIEAASKEVLKLFSGSEENVTAEQLKTIIEQIDTLRKGIDQALLLPFFEETRTKIQGLTETFNKFTGNLEKGFGDSSKEASLFLDFVNKINKVPRIPQFSARSGLSRDLFDLSVLKVEQLQKANRDLANTIEDAVTQIVKYQAELDILSTTLDTSKTAQERFEVVTKLSTQTIDQTADAIVKLIDPIRLFGEAAKGVADITAKGLIARRTQADARATATIFDAVVVKLRESAKAIGLSASEVTELLPLMKKIGLVMSDSSLLAVGGIDAISFSVTAFLSALKKTTGAVISGFAAQFNAIAKFSTLASGIGSVFNASEQTLKTVDDALNRVLTTITDNARAVANLNLEMKGLTILRDEIAADETIALTDKDAIPKLNKQIEAFRLRLESLGITQAKNKADLNAQVTALLELRKNALTVVEAEKRREQVLRAQTKLFSTLTEAQIQLAKLKFTNLTEALKETVILRKKLLEVELEEIDKLVDLEKLEKEKGKRLKDQLVFQFNIAAVTERIAAKQERLTKLYGDIRDSAQDVGQVFSDMLGDQEAFFDILESKGSLLEIFKRTASGIAEVIARGDAEIIGRAIGRGSKGLFQTAKDEIKKIENEINDLISNADLGLTVKEPIIEGAKTAGELLKQGILDGISIGSDVFAAAFAIQLLKSIKAGEKVKDEFADRRINKELALKDAAKSAEDTRIASNVADFKLQSFKESFKLDLKTLTAQLDSLKNPSDFLPARFGTGDSREADFLSALEPLPPVDLHPGFKAFGETSSFQKVSLEQGKSAIEILTEQARFAKEDAAKADATLKVLQGQPGVKPEDVKKANDDAANTVVKGVSDAVKGQSISVTVDFPDTPNIFDTSKKSFQFSPLDPLFVFDFDKALGKIREGVDLGTQSEEALSRESDKLLNTVGDQAAQQRERLINVQIKTIEIMAKANSNLDGIAADDDAVKKARNTQLVDALSRRIGTIVGQALGFAIAKGRGADTGAVSTGSNLGGLVGGIIGLSKGSGPTGTAIGSIVGSILGGLFGGKKELEEEKAILSKIERNTAALVDRLTSEIFNAPANFVLPSGQGSGGAIIITNNFNVTDGSISDGDLRAISNQVNSLFDRSGSQSSILTR